MSLFDYIAGGMRSNVEYCRIFSNFLEFSRIVPGQRKKQGPDPHQGEPG
jgi:hypothetical protein